MSAGRDDGHARDAEVVLRRCDELAAFTARPGRVDRFHLTPEHRLANDAVAQWMSQAGLRTWQDAAGNQWGRLEGARPGLPALVLGSHTDTVPDAGRYDGPLGVVAAVQVAGRLAGRAEQLPFALEVVAFGDEEGTRFGGALTGSRAVAGGRDPAVLDRLDDAGVSVREALSAFGLDPDRVGEAARTPDSLVAYLELHIEQGARLEDADRPLGVVTGIAGARRFALTVHGEARHAGGTTWERRRDALVGASRIVLDVERLARAGGVVATVGRLQVHPGAVNVVPGRVDLSLDLRAGTDAARDEVWRQILAAAEQHCARGGLALAVDEPHRAPAVVCAPWLREAVRAGVEDATGEGSPPELLSLAGHDAMAVAEVTDVGMLFVRCGGGISHHPAESVLVGDVVKALDAFEAGVLAVAAACRSREAATDLATFNTAEDDDARALVAPCVDIASWVEGVVAGRPYADVADLLVRAERLAEDWTPAEVDAALARHPRIGERPTAGDREAAMSRTEQSGVSGGADLAERLRAGNLAYEERFGRVFLIRAAGRTGEQVLAALTERLAHDPETESAVTTGQLREITLLRLRGLVAP